MHTTTKGFDMISLRKHLDARPEEGTSTLGWGVYSIIVHVNFPFDGISSGHVLSLKTHILMRFQIGMEE